MPNLIISDLNIMARSFIINMLLYQWLKFRKSLGAHHPITRGGGGVVFVADKFFISTKLGGSLKISNFIICLYRTVLDVNYLFHRICLKLYI